VSVCPPPQALASPAAKSVSAAAASAFTATTTPLRNLSAAMRDAGEGVLASASQRMASVVTVATPSSFATPAAASQPGTPRTPRTPAEKSAPHTVHSDEKVANREIRVWHGATETGP
jgi:hypothetical protein